MTCEHTQHRHLERLIETYREVHSHVSCCVSVARLTRTSHCLADVAQRKPSFVKKQRITNLIIDDVVYVDQHSIAITCEVDISHYCAIIHHCKVCWMHCAGNGLNLVIVGSRRLIGRRRSAVAFPCCSGLLSA